MNWRIAQAKQRFSELINAATKEPQMIYNRERLVAVVIEAEMFQEFLAWRDRREKTSLADAFSLVGGKPRALSAGSASG